MKLSKTLLIIGLIFSLPTSLYAAGAGGVVLNPLSASFVQGEDNPVQFALALRPSAYPTTTTMLSQGAQLRSLSAGKAGLVIDTVVASGEMQGGLSYFSGTTNKSSAPDYFSSFYFSNGWDIPEAVLLLPNDESQATSQALSGGQKSADMQAISLYGDYELTPSLKIKGAFLISKSKSESEVTNFPALSDTTYSWWVDLGGDYKLNEKMTYSINFGYYDSGETYSDLNSNDSVQGNVYLFNNHLNMTF